MAMPNSVEKHSKDDTESRTIGKSSPRRAAVMISSVAGEFAARKSIGFVVNKIGKKQRSSSGKFGIIPIATQGTTALVSYFLMKKLGEDHIAKCVDYLNSKIVDTSMQES